MVTEETPTITHRGTELNDEGNPALLREGFWLISVIPCLVLAEYSSGWI
ncbi:MAG: hypothetical protein ACC642_08745 [Pseudomonadales bacterium]